MNKNLTIFHEAPLAIFDDVQKVTGGDYFLANVFETDPEYLEKAKESVAKGRKTILDNGVFELGTAMDLRNFLKWIQILKPEYYIVPDVLEDGEGTIKNMVAWIEMYGSEVPEGCKAIGVAQGKDIGDFQACYDFMSTNPFVKKIALSFDFSWFCRKFTCEHPNRLVRFTEGRKALLTFLNNSGTVNREKPHHLLGCSLPFEFGFYKNNPEFDFIESIDTSNPVVAGLKGLRYVPGFGLGEKPSEKLYTMIKSDVTPKQKEDILYNIEEFSKICK